MSPRSRRAALDDLETKIHNSRSFQGLRGGDFFPGRGNLDPKIMFVAQDPLTAHWQDPLWEHLLSLATAARSEVWTTTVIKHVAASKRPSTQAEREAGQEYLHTEVDLVRPRVVALINSAVEMIFGAETKITTVHGRTITTRLDHGHVTWVPVYGPSYLREHRNRPMVESGYRLLGKIISGEGAQV